MELKLVDPSAEYMNSFLDGLRGFQREGLPWHLQINAYQIEIDFTAHVQHVLNKRHTRTATFVPETEMWAIVDGKYAGRISIRHELNENLKIVGGHIGYDTVPDFRGRGVATCMLKMALPIAKTLGLSEVLLTCDDDNAPSIRVIEKNGGVLRETKKVPSSGTFKRYYWIKII